MPEISVIVPVYNAEKYLNKCIESILSQSFNDLELILVNDGSKDSSGAICDEYVVKDERVKVIHRENAGVSSARNTGIDIACGKYIMFVDSDDYIKKDMLSEMVEYMNKGYDLVFTEIEMTVSDGTQIFEMEEKEYDARQLIEAFCVQSFPKINLCGPWAKLYKKNIINENKIYFNTELHNGEDTYFNLTYLQYCQSIKALNKAFYMYIRDNNDSLFSKVRKYTYSNTCVVFDYTKKIAEKYNCESKVIEQLLKTHIFGTIALVNKAIISSDKKTCISLMKEISENKVFTDNIIKLRKKLSLYLIALLIRNKYFDIAYYICLCWRKLKR